MLGLCRKGGSPHQSRVLGTSGGTRARQGLGSVSVGGQPSVVLSSQVLGFLFFATAYFLYKRPSGSSHGLEASLPSQSSASDNPSDLQAAPSTLQLQSSV